MSDYSKEVYSYKNVKSRVSITQTIYSVFRYPDNQHGINDVCHAVRAAVEALGGMQNFVKPFDKVLIKVNLSDFFDISEGSYKIIPTPSTTKEVVGVVVDMVHEVNGEPIVCDADADRTKFQSIVEADGWIEWAIQKGVKLLNLSESEIVRFDFGNDSVLRIEHVSIEMIDADVIISIPAMKMYPTTGVALGMENLSNTLTDTGDKRYHMLDINEVIFWICHAFTPNLTIIDGSIGYEPGSTQPYETVDFHTIIASNNVVTADAIAAQLMGFSHPYEDIDHIKIAHERGLGDGSLQFDIAYLPYAHILDCNWRWFDPALLIEIQDISEKVYQQLKGTISEKIADTVNQKVQNWVIDKPEKMQRNMDNLIFTLKQKIPDTPINKNVYDKIEDISNENNLATQYELLSIIIALIPQIVIEGNMTGDIYSNVHIEGTGNVVGSNNVISINHRQLAKIPDEYAKSLQAFSEAVNAQLKKHNVSQEKVAPVQESINELMNEVDIKPEEKIDIEKKEGIKDKIKKVAISLLKILPEGAETVATFTPLAPFSKIIGQGVEEIVKEFQK